MKNLKDLDPKSIEFINKVEKKFKDQDFINTLLFNITQQVKDYYENIDREQLKEKLLDKLHKGAIEHGEPVYPQEDVLDAEIEAELLDLIGWTLIKKYTKGEI